MSRIDKALEKAKAARESGESISEADFIQVTDNMDIYSKAQDRTREEVKPAYTKTRVMKVDPDELIKNRIISLSHDDPINDQIKILRTQVLDRMKQLGANTLLVASANPNEGKTLIALNLAISISQEVGHTVLLVEADMRTSSINDFLNLGSRKGLSDFLMKEAEIEDTLVNPGIEKLVILPAGRFIKTSAELLGSSRMEVLVKEMKNRYPDRFIIFDGPAILSFADPLAFSRFVDAILLVVEAEKTSKKDIARMMELFKGKPVIGAIYNKAKE
jgi:protein-tyrosine kinase